MFASPELYKPTEAPPAFSPSSCATQPPLDDECRTPTGSRISYLREPTTCPPAPRKPMCRKRLFQLQGDRDQRRQPADSSSVVVPAAVISLRLHELELIFRPHPPPATNTTTTTTDDKRRLSSSSSVSANKHCAA